MTVVYRHRAKEQAVIVLWHPGGAATGGEPYEDTHAYFMRMRGGEVESSSCNDLWDLVRPGER